MGMAQGLKVGVIICSSQLKGDDVIYLQGLRHDAAWVLTAKPSARQDGPSACWGHGVAFGGLKGLTGHLEALATEPGSAHDRRDHTDRQEDPEASEEACQ